MIRVDRTRVPKPAVLDSPKALKERQEAERFYREEWSRTGTRTQHRFDFRLYKEMQIREALTELFHGKCAYCEARFATVSPPDIEQYRPKASVAESPEHPGYWWLASDWDNLLVSCPDCNRVRMHEGERVGKANRFPLVDESRRAWEPGQEMGELPLLLDPCRDEPAEHLVFDETGRVVSGTPRGQATISVLGLNRRGLLDARGDVAVRIQGIGKLLEDLVEVATPKAREAAARQLSDLARMTEETEEFAGLKRQLVRPIIERFSQASAVAETVQASELGPRITKARQKDAKTKFRQFEHEQSSYSLADAKGRETYRSERRLIEQVKIRNVKAIRELDLDLTDPGTGRTPWLMLLGENGTGKSTILQAIALTLVGAHGILRLGTEGSFHPSDYVRYRCKSGTVSVKMSGFVGPHRLTFRHDGVEFTTPTGEVSKVSFKQKRPTTRAEGWHPQTVLLGYGATRLMPRKATAALPTGDTFSRIDNLFDPFVPLVDAEAWLAKRKGVEFSSAVLVLKDLLSLGPDAELEVEGRRVMVRQHGDKVPLRTLSDGYQSVVATAVDIFEVVTRLWPNLDDAEGIVLLDELGAHLHPTWRMRIVESIRKALPGIQFITSTHDPLCLRGLTAGEVVVMQRDENEEVRALTGLPSPGDFRIDQLLTSDFFGLSSTVDPQTDTEFHEYYALLAVQKPNKQQRDRITYLAGRFKDSQHMGSTPREMLMYEAVDRVVARHRRERRTDLPEMKKEAVDRIARLWAQGERRAKQS